MSQPKFINYTPDQVLSGEEMKFRAGKFYDLMKKRRSIRDFSSEIIPLEVIESCVKAASSAPSGANKQPWHFVIIKDAETKKKIRIAAEKEEWEFYNKRASKEWLNDIEQFGTNEQKPFLETAPYLIAVFAEKFSVVENAKQSKNYYVMESVGIACGILITALHYSGVSTLTHTPSPMNFLNEICMRPSSEKPFVLIVLGLPNRGAKVPNITKKSFEEIVTIL